MTQLDYEIITADKIEGVTKEAATAALESRYPEHLVVVEEIGNEFVATLARKTRVGKTTVAADDEGLDLLDDEPKEEEAPKEKPELSEEDGPKTPKEPKAPKEPKGLEDSLKDDEGEDGEGGDEVSQVVKALKTLEHLLPKIKDQLGVGGDDVLDTPELGGPGGPGGLHGPGGPGGLPGGPPHGGPHPPTGPEGLGPLGDDVGPTPGKPPLPPRRPPVPTGAPDARRNGPPVGVPAFGNVKKNKVIIRPREDEDGTIVTLAQATAEIESHPKYAGYEIVNIKPDGDTYKALLKYRQG